MPRLLPRHSLQRRAILALALLFLLLLVRSTTVGLLAWFGQQDAAAAMALARLHGDLYGLDLQQQSRPGADATPYVERIREDLASPPLVAAAGRPFRPGLAQSLQGLRQHWEAGLLPALARGDHEALHRETERLGARLDAMAADLQAEMDRVLRIDLFVHVLSLLVSAAIMVTLIVGLRRRVLAPLDKLLDVADQFRAGRLDVRVHHPADDEFGRLAQRFNVMAADIEASHQALEARMQAELRNLGRANSALALFCDSSRRIAHAETSAAEIDQLLQRFQAVLPGLRLTLCLHPVKEQPAGHVISFRGGSDRRVCSYQDCDNCEHFQAPHQRLFPVRCQGQVLGELRASIDRDRPLDEWEAMLTQTFADLVGNALRLGQQRERDNFLLLHNERNTIARELHDSLAQALSYLKVQVTRLQMLVERGDPAPQVLEASETLSDGLDAAYGQLRELLTTFRLALSDSDLGNALKVAVEEFSRRGSLHIFLQAEELVVPLAATEEIHLLQIVRECLSNCCRHAGASQVWVWLRQVGEEVELVVEDNGQGFAQPGPAHLHHGLAIMKERARSLNGQLDVGPREGGGARVRLAFRPLFLAEASKEKDK